MDSETQAASALKFILRDVVAAPPPPDSPFSWDGLHRVDAPSNMPPTYLVKLALERHADAEFVLRPFEKIAWVTAVSFRGVLLVVSSEKFGLRIRVSITGDSDPQAIVQDFADVLERAVPQIERAMDTEIRDLIRAGSITIRNQFRLFRDRYEYLRKLAASNYASKPPPPTVKGSVTTYHPFKPEREGFFVGSVALDSYFSWLEHVLILLVPFSGFDGDREDLAALITACWTEKFKRVFDLSSDRAAKSVYEQLLSLKEDHRNPLGHGGLDRSLTAFRVHMRGIGAIPARLSKTPLSQSWIHPLTQQDFSGICDQLDEADKFLEHGTHELGYRFIAGGINVCFDPASVRMYESALADPDGFDSFLDYVSFQQDAHANFEW